MLLSLLTLLSQPAIAQTQPAGDLAEEADLHFSLAVEAYKKGDYRGALEHLLTSNRLAPNRNVVFNIASTYEKLGQYDNAFRNYHDYARMEPDPTLRQPALDAMERIASRVALVHVEAAPAGATVYVDRKDLGARGVTPLTLALPPGEHTLIIEAEGYGASSAKAQLVVGKQVDVRLELERILGTVELSGGPDGAEVRLGGAEGAVVGTLPGELRLPPGQHVLFISSPGYREARELVTVEANQSVPRIVELAVLTGTLVVDAVERGALIEIDGEPAGFTPSVLDVPVGEHNVRVSMPGFRAVEQQVTVVADSRASVEFRLRSQQELTAASRTAQRAEDAPASVSVISGEEIRAFGYQELYDALAGTRGIFNTNDLTYQYLGFRGFARPGDYGSRVLVTIDGHTMNDDQLGASYVGSDLLVDLADVEQVEVVRGPGSALYGTNAFFGVINLVTRQGDTALPNHVQLSADSGRSLRARAGTRVGDEHAGAWASVAMLTGQGQDYYFAEFFSPPDGDGQVLDADDTRAATVQGKAWVKDLSVQVYANGRDKRFATGAFETEPGDPQASSGDFRAFGELRYEPKLGDIGRLYLRATVDHYRYSGDFPYGTDGTLHDRWRGAWAGAEPRVVLTPIKGLDLTAGAEFRYNFMADLTGSILGDSYVDEQPTQLVASGYGVVEWYSLSWLRATLGGRYDYFTLGEVGGAFNPRAALVLQPTDDDVLKLLAGTAFRAPSPYELFYNDGDGGTQIKPDSLTPERVRTAEVEYNHRFTEVTSATSAVYFNQIFNLIDTDVVPNQEEVFRYVNTDAPVYTGGAELELRQDWRRGTMVAAQGSLQRTRVGSLASDERLTNSPWALVGLKGATPFVIPGTTISSRFRVGSPRLTTQDTETSWAYLWDITLTGALPSLPLSYALGVRNALDWKEEHPGGYDLVQDAVPQPGRSLFVSVRYTF